MIAVGAMTWRSLAFVHWAVSPRPVRAQLPPGVELDTYGGDAFIGLVPFQIEAARPRFLPPVPGVSSFPEINLRTYVTVDGEPGIWFFSLDADSALAVLGARAVYALPYFRADAAVEEAGADVAYHARRRWPGQTAELDAVCHVGEPLGLAAAGSLEEFLIERYVLYAWRGDRVRRARVRHAPYALCRAEIEVRRESLRRAADLPSVGARVDDYFCRSLRVEVGAPRRADPGHALALSRRRPGRAPRR